MSDVTQEVADAANTLTQGDYDLLVSVTGQGTLYHVPVGQDEADASNWQHTPRPDGDDFTGLPAVPASVHFHVRPAIEQLAATKGKTVMGFSVEYEEVTIRRPKVVLQLAGEVDMEYIAPWPAETSEDYLCSELAAALHLLKAVSDLP